MSRNSSKVGYGMPPKAGQWKKGQSGNPSGKKKEPQPLPEQPMLEALARQFRSPIEMTAGGKTESVPFLTAFVMKFMRDSLSAPFHQKLAALTILDKLGVLSLHKVIIETEPANDDEEIWFTEEHRRLIEIVEREIFFDDKGAPSSAASADPSSGKGLA